MKKKIIILGSTGSIGKTTLDIIGKNKEKFEITLLTTNKNIKELSKQIKKFNPKNVLISDKKKFDIFLSKNKSKNTKLFNNFNHAKKAIKSKVDYTMCSISGINGLNPILDLIPLSKKIAVANKESIICGWNLLIKKIKKHKTLFVPVDSEHFSIWSLIKNENNKLIDKVYITASGGPFLKWSKKQMTNITPKQALNHPKWSMGKKISIDSATMMNKVFEVIETQKIFDLPKKNIEILIHEDSYLHAIVQFKNGLKKMLIHDTDMKIPIFNTIYENKIESLESQKLKLEKLNHLNLQRTNKSKFPLLKVLNLVPNKNTLYETVIVSCNDELVNLFLEKKITYSQLHKFMMKILLKKYFLKYKNKEPKNVQDIINLNNFVRLKVRELCI